MASRPYLLIRPESDRKWSMMALSTLFVLLQVATTPLIIFYDPTHSARNNEQQQSSMLECLFHHDLRFPDFISDPSPAAFILASIAYAFGAASFYQLHANDRYQSRFLAGAVSAAILISSPHPIILKSWLPGAITLALLLSTAAHHSNPKWRRQAAEGSEDTDEKQPDSKIEKMSSSSSIYSQRGRGSRDGEAHSQ